MTEEESKLCDAAVKFIKDHRHELIGKFADPALYRSVENPVSLFTAGSPGVGKTEVSKRLIARFDNQKPVRIDADEIRAMLPGYTGANAYIFQRACSKGVDKLHDYVVDHRLNMIMDSTFSGAIKKNLK